MHQFGLCLVLLAEQQLIAKWEGGRKLFVQNNVIGYRMELVTTSNTANKEQTNMMTKKAILETSHRKSDSLGFISSTFFFVYNKQ